MIHALDLIMFATTCALLMAGFPVAFTLAGVALMFGFIGHSFDIFDVSFFYALPQRIFGTMTNEVLMAVPLFVFMGTMLERARIAEDLLENMSRLFGTLRGGLGISRSEEHTSELQSQSTISYAVFCLKKKKQKIKKKKIK